MYWEQNKRKKIRADNLYPNPEISLWGHANDTTSLKYSGQFFQHYSKQWKACFALELCVMSYVSIATRSYVPSRDAITEFSRCSYNYILLRYVAQFCKRIYKFTTHGNVAQLSEVKDTFHYVALQT